MVCRSRALNASTPSNPFGVVPWVYCTIFDNFISVSRESAGSSANRPAAPNRPAERPADLPPAALAIATRQVGANFAFDWDMAVIKLAEPVGDEAGWLGVANGCPTSASNGNAAPNYPVTTAGYPVLAPFGTCLTSNCSISNDTCARTALHTCPSYDGQSGAPFMYIGSDGSPRIRGILVGTKVRPRRRRDAWPRALCLLRWAARHVLVLTLGAACSPSACYRTAPRSRT